MLSPFHPEQDEGMLTYRPKVQFVDQVYSHHFRIFDLHITDNLVRRTVLLFGVSDL